jgi:hypothetical protein
MAPTGGSNGRIGTVSSLSVMLRARPTRPGESGLSCALRDVRLLRDALTADKDWPLAADVYAEQHDEFWERLHDAERLSAAALMSVGPAGASRRARALEIFDRVPELETWTYGPEAHCDDAVRAELLA